jgi:hypothetical protein
MVLSVVCLSSFSSFANGIVCCLSFFFFFFCQWYCLLSVFLRIMMKKDRGHTIPLTKEEKEERQTTENTIDKRRERRKTDDQTTDNTSRKANRGSNYC